MAASLEIAAQLRDGTGLQPVHPFSDSSLFNRYSVLFLFSVLICLFRLKDFKC